jgi:MoxR-like ATPase
MQAEVKNIHVEANMMDYIVQLCAAVSENKEIATGPSTRASIAMMNVARAQAYLQGRDSVYPDDIKKVLPFVLRHRIVLKSGTARNDHIIENLLHDISNSISVPMD